MFVVGVTGGIASGKSNIARIFRKLGLEALDADKLAHEVAFLRVFHECADSSQTYAQGTPTYHKIIQVRSEEVN
jgi:hypothetical protein